MNRSAVYFGGLAPDWHGAAGAGPGAACRVWAVCLLRLAAADGLGPQAAAAICIRVLQRGKLLQPQNPAPKNFEAIKVTSQ